MIPLRFRVIRPYLASFLHTTFNRPGVDEVARWLFQPGKERRANRFIVDRIDEGEFYRIQFRGLEDTPFYFPKTCRWIDLCQTIDECFNPKNWHHFFSNEVKIEPTDVVLDCGAAEGLFTLIAAPKAKKVFAIEPVPKWQKSLSKTFANHPNVEVIPVALGHRQAELRMTDDEICARISADGELVIQVETIDHLFFEQQRPVDFIKADVEGFEFQTLLGAERTIRENRPKISFTVYHSTNHFVEMREFLKDLHPDYHFATRGIAETGNPVLFQAY